MATTQSPSDNLPLQILPPEIVCLIFDCLAADRDRASLRACTLLSHQYLDHTRGYLFACITLKLRNYPDRISIQDVVQRMDGLCDMFHRDPRAKRYVKSFVILDTNSRYVPAISQQPSLPRLINNLTSVQHCTYGFEVGYIDWGVISPELAASLERLFDQQTLLTLTLLNLGRIPVNVLCNSLPYLYLNNVTTSHSAPTNFTRSRLSYLNLRTVSLDNTASAWELMQAHSRNLRIIRWLCWDDPNTADSACFPGPIDLGLLPSLKRLSIRISCGTTARDLVGFCQMLEAITQRSALLALELSVLIPRPVFPAAIPDVCGQAIWTRLAAALLRPEYRSLRRVSIEFTIHSRMRMWFGNFQTSVSEFNKQLKPSLQVLTNITSFNVQFNIRTYHH